jgi:hypothetical protein
MPTTICPFCLNIFLYSQELGDDCPECGIGILENLQEYNKRTAELDTDDNRKEDAN